MSRSTSRIRVGTRRRVLAVMGIGLATATAASGCAAGQIAATAEVVSAVEGSSGTVGPIALRDVKLASPRGGQYQSGQDARLTLVMVNGGLADDALTSVRTTVADQVTFQTPSPAVTGSASPSVSATPSVTATPLGSASATPSASASAPEGGTPGAGQVDSIPLPANHSVLAYADGPRVTLVDLATALRSSQTVTLTFSFRRAGDITLVVPVAVPVSPGPQPSPIDVSPTAER